MSPGSIDTGGGARRTPAIAPLAAAFLAASVLLPGAAARADDGAIGIELNRLQQVDDACRISLVFTNRRETPVEALSIETVLFNTDGAVERFLVLKSNPLPPGKIRAQQFDATGIACESVGRLLLNDVKECEAADLTREGCLEAIAPSSRVEADFVSTTRADAAAEPETGGGGQ